LANKQQLKNQSKSQRIFWLFLLEKHLDRQCTSRAAV
jgi:hypothetical protein